ncbi:hypothetical protein BU26DRAFT_567452 [Trematosphaeria pertusa]|uniref:Uncharacterized protein n=1 Tax=Trematosphaeria pertusa TaxID=390896 RepID=A0A6A6I5Y1_9PLEO|nr:uncharacterized protein BU26DRAFT_567452 [Trematosphaeria pertusa]KAF2245935.1 hypothetical protein BU26DRAFT_567452 [Trematosphaeria pertusa]
MPSLFESLPAETFNRILSYLLHYKETARPGTSTRPRRYAFEPVVLRLNNAIYNLARSFFHKQNQWIVVNLNVPRLLISPEKFGIPVFCIPNSHLVGRLPEGVIRADIMFPTPIQDERVWLTAQERTCSYTGHPIETTCTTYLVLPPDLRDFISYLRLNVLTYCARVRNGAVFTAFAAIQERVTVAGLSINLELAPDAPPEYRALLGSFSALHGHFHQFTIKNNPDIQLSNSIRRSITTSHPDPSSIISECVKAILWLQRVAEEHMVAGRYALALTSYMFCNIFNDCSPLCNLTIDFPYRLQLWCDNLYYALAATNTANACLARVRGNLYHRGEDADSRKLMFNHEADAISFLTDQDANGSAEKLFAGVYEAILGADKILNSIGDRMLDARRMKIMWMSVYDGNHPIDSVYRPFIRALENLLSEYYRTNLEEKKTAHLRELMREVKPWRWLIHEDDYSSDMLDLGLQLVDGDEEGRYSLFEIPWGGEGRPGQRYLL